MPEFHAEPYIYLAGLTHKSALIAWGGFYFRVSGNEDDGNFKLVDDHNLDHAHPPRHQTIGASSEPYGQAEVEVREAATNNPVVVAKTDTVNHVLIQGLQPDTEYTYKITVNGEEWGAGERRDWVAPDDDHKGLKNIGGRYDNRFHTHPHPEVSAPLTFAALGDFGTGVRKPSSSDKRQREVAAALERAVNEQNVRLILTTGDNIYAKTFLGIPSKDSGDEDDDWFFTFYQPYRYIINRIPVYPCVGNHDSGETEKSDDRRQLLDNFYLAERFTGEEAAGRASLDPGLFYRFRYGSDIEFVCLDTSKESIIDRRLFLSDKHAEFVQSSFPDSGEGGPAWRIPFSHHPPFCAGPQHHNSRSMIDALVPLFKRSGVRVVLSGHEHNFQHSKVDDISYFVTGSGGKLRPNKPTRFEDAGTSSWAAATHFLLVNVAGQQMTVRPIGELGAGGELADILLRDPKNQIVGTPIVIANSDQMALSQTGD